jgi:hypothetical protein
METNNFSELPLVEFFIKDKKTNSVGRLKAISIVTDPAIEESFQLFNNKVVKSEFKVTNNDKMEITGPVMIPNKKILRRDESTGEYYNCFFSPATVKECAELYLYDCNHNKGNFEHENLFTDKVRVIESWIVEHPERDKSKALGFSGVKKGTWFVTFKCYDQKLWSELKKSDFSGFSVEGDFLFSGENIAEESEITSQMTLKEIDSICDNVELSREEKLRLIDELLNGSM